MASKLGKAVLFDESQARTMGRSAAGVRGMKLVDPEDAIVSAFAIDKTDFESMSVLTVTERGYGKRTLVSDYRLTKRGAQGVKNIKITDKTGVVVSSLPVPVDGEGVNISLINSDGILIRTRVINIRVMGRNTQGVRVMRIKGKQKLLKASHIVEEQKHDTEDEGSDMVDPELANLDDAEIVLDDLEDEEYALDELEEDDLDEEQ